MLYPVIKRDTGTMPIKTKSSEIFWFKEDECRPATKAEIAAHKLGFHIGDLVWISGSFESRIIESISFEHFSSRSVIFFTNGGCAGIINILTLKLLKEHLKKDK